MPYGANSDEHLPWSLVEPRNPRLRRALAVIGLTGGALAIGLGFIKPSTTEAEARLDAATSEVVQSLGKLSTALRVEGLHRVSLPERCEQELPELIERSKRDGAEQAARYAETEEICPVPALEAIVDAQRDNEDIARYRHVISEGSIQAVSEFVWINRAQNQTWNVNTGVFVATGASLMVGAAVAGGISGASRNY